jgi:signal transduction histidine kinase
MADASAAVLVDAILYEDTTEAAGLLGEQLLADPPLALWAVCCCWKLHRLRPRSIEELGRWLTEHAVEVLQWGPDREKALAATDDPQRGRYAELVATRLEIADMAALLSSSEGQSAAEEAFLMGLLHEPAQWWSGAEDEHNPAAVDTLLPDWLIALNTSAATERVAEAVEILVDEGGPGSDGFDAEGCRRRAQEGRSRWLEEISGPGDRLPALTARLARLKALEDRFERVLKTEKLSAMAEFAAGAGHEINNPLAIIGGRAQLLLKDEKDPERRRELALMIAQVKRAHEMIADIRLFARPPKSEPKNFDLIELVDRAVADLTPQFVEQASTIRRTGHDGPLEIEADPAQMNVALRAMCRNALEAIRHDGHIEIHVEGSDQEVVLRVSDDGPGISPKERPHLFDPFYSSRQAGRGLGTGLSKCWRIITGHGGTIDVESEPGKGATFTVTLPRRP